MTLDHVVSYQEAGEGSPQAIPGRSGRDLTATFCTLSDRHALILPRPTRTRNSGRAPHRTLQNFAEIFSSPGLLDVLKIKKSPERNRLRRIVFIDCG